MFKSEIPISDEKLSEIRSECLNLFLDALNKVNKLNTKFSLIAFSFNSESGFLNVTNKNDYELYTEKIKNLSEAIEPLLKHLDIR